MILAKTIPTEYEMFFFSVSRSSKCRQLNAWIRVTRQRHTTDEEGKEQHFYFSANRFSTVVVMLHYLIFSFL